VRSNVDKHSEDVDNNNDNVGKLTYTSGKTGARWDPAEAPEIRQTAIALSTSDAGLTSALARHDVTRLGQRSHRVTLAYVCDVHKDENFNEKSRIFS